MVVHNEFAPHDSVRFRVPASLKAARFPQPSHLLFKTRDDRVKILFFTRERPFLSDFEPFVWALRVDQCGSPVRNAIPQQQVERRANPGIEPPFEMYKECRKIAEPVQKRRACIWGR